MEKLFVLFLDDMQARHNLIMKNKYNNVIIVSAYTVDDAINLMKSKKFDIVSLDHDLGFGHGIPDNKAPTGMEAVKYLCGLENKDRPDNVIVHTMNPPAGDRMEQTLRKAGYKVIRKLFDGSL